MITELIEGVIFIGNLTNVIEVVTSIPNVLLRN